MSFDGFCENKILGKISEFTVPALKEIEHLTLVLMYY